MVYESPGFVSIWIGSFGSESELFDFVDFVYDEDGDSSNAFATEARLGWFDHDFQETRFLQAGIADADRALGSHSYSSSFRAAAAAAIYRAAQMGDNALFLLYDCDYDPAQAKPNPAARLRFVGSFPYTLGAPADEIDNGDKPI